jgi:Flp pilus assembly protein TadG
MQGDRANSLGGHEGSTKPLTARKYKSGPVRLLRDERGQVLPWVAVVLLVVLVSAALSIDLGYAMVVKRQLQVSADAAALAAAETMPNTNYSTVGTNYSAGSGDKNDYTGFNITNTTVTPLCITSIKNLAPCSSSQPNAVSVTQTTTINTIFAALFGKTTLPLSATSTAATRGAIPLPYNVAIVVDSTLSMNALDTNCGTNVSQMQCAMTGVQTLLQSLTPSVDHVALFTFPNVATNSTAGIVSSGSYGCTTAIPSSSGSTSYSRDGSNSSVYDAIIWTTTPFQAPWSGVATAMPYTFPPVPSNTKGYTPPSGTYGPTYEVVPFSTDYRTSNTATSLSSSSNLVKAAGGVSSCGGIRPSNYDGNNGTYYAGAIYAAQAALLKEQTLNAGSKNVMVVLGDGDSTSPDPTSEATWFSSVNNNMPGMPTSATQATTTYKTSTTLNTTAYTVSSGWSQAGSSGNYPSYVGECGQAIDAAQAAATYSGNNTLMYTISYGAVTTSQARSRSNPNGNCGTDVSAGNHPGVTPCQTLQKMATIVTGYSISPYFYSDYNVPGGDSGCVANSANSGITSLSQIFTAIANSLTSVTS